MPKQPLDRDEVSMYIDAPPADAYALIADVTRTPEYSPEIIECSWLDGATEAKVGARFVARNDVGRGRPWRNKPIFTHVDPGRALSWARTEPFAGTVEWSYRFEPEGTGTRVVESYEVTKPIGRVGWFIIGTLYRQKDRRQLIRTNIERSLERVASILTASKQT
jgi:hypothetical protein